MDAEVQKTLNELQKRASELLQQGQNPRQHDLSRKAPARELTLAAAFDIYLGDEGPGEDWSKLHRQRNALVRDRVIGILGPNTEIRTLSLRGLRRVFLLRRRQIQAESRVAAARRAKADAAALKKREEVGRLDQKKGYHRREADQRMPKRKVQHVALRQSGAAHVQDGLRQATIEIRCVLAMLRWLADEYEVPNAPTFSRPRFLARANKKGPAPRQERFTDEEVAKIERRLPDADPRLRLLLTIQNAQRVGQLLRAWRSGLEVERDAQGEVASVSVLVPGQRNKPAGPYYLTPEGMRALIEVLERGYLRELDARFRKDGTDFPLFPGLERGQRFVGGKGVGTSRRLAPDGIVPVGTYGTLDKDTANSMFLDLEHEARVTHRYLRGFHGFRRRAVDILVEAGATPQEIQAAGSWTSLRTPLEVYRRKLNDADRRRSAALLAGRTLRPAETTASSATGTPARAIGPASLEEPKPTAILTSDRAPESGPAEELDLVLNIPCGPADELGTQIGTPLTQALKAKHLPDSFVEEVLEVTQWAMRGSNPRPRACEARALTS